MPTSFDPGDSGMISGEDGMLKRLGPGRLYGRSDDRLGSLLRSLREESGRNECHPAQIIISFRATVCAMCIVCGVSSIHRGFRQRLRL